MPVVNSVATTPSRSDAWRSAVGAAGNGLDALTDGAYVATTAIFASVMLLAVFFRYVLNDSLQWADEVAVFAFFWATFLSAATTYRRDKHLRIDLVVSRLRGKTATVADTLAEGISGGFLGVLLVAGIAGAPLLARASSDALRLPLLLPFAAIPIAAAIMLIHWIRRNWAARSYPRLLASGLVAALLTWAIALPFGAVIQLESDGRLLMLAVSFVLPLILGVPVSFALGMAGAVYLAEFGSVGIDTVALQIFQGLQVLTLVAVPLLILSGTLMHAAGIADRMVSFAQLLVGRVRGGLGASNVVASFIFGDISGSAVSDTAAIGTIMIPGMKARGYRPDFCAALQGAAGTLGMMAPLSISLLLYATATGNSVSRLAAATIVPALIVAGSFIAYTLIHARRHGYPREERAKRDALARTLSALPGLFAIVLIAGGILGGVFTPAEVGAVLVFYVLLLSVFLYRTATPKLLYEKTVEAGHISGMTLLMVGTSALVGFVLARDMVPFVVRDAIFSWTTDPLILIFIANAVIIVLGMVLEAPAIIFGFLPSLLPLLLAAGVDPIHFGVLFLVNMGLGMLIPPVALNLFISTRIAGVTYGRAVLASVPFILIMLADLALMAFLPQIPLSLPHFLFDYPLP